MLIVVGMCNMLVVEYYCFLFLFLQIKVTFLCTRTLSPSVLYPSRLVANSAVQGPSSHLILTLSPGVRVVVRESPFPKSFFHATEKSPEEVILGVSLCPSVIC